MLNFLLCSIGMYIGMVSAGLEDGFVHEKMLARQDNRGAIMQASFSHSPESSLFILSYICTMAAALSTAGIYPTSCLLEMSFMPT